MKNHRVFIAINLPSHIKQKLVKYQQQWPDLPVRWTKEPSLHITLVFIGHVDNDEMLDICQLVKEIGKKHSGFEIRLNKVELGPPGRSPRMIWASGEKNIEIAKLRDDLENSLLKSKSSFNLKQAQAFSPHITLARIKPWEWKQLDKQPDIEKGIDLSFPVDSIEVMESHLLRSGAEYSVLESVALEE